MLSRSFAASFCRLGFAGLSLALAIFVTAASAQTAPDQSAEKAHIDEVLRGLSRGRSIGQVAISPDGSRLAWIEYGREAGIRVSPIGDLSKAEQVKLGDRCQQSDLVWRPDSKSLAFFAVCGDSKQTDLYLSHLDGQPASRLTRLNGYVNDPAFSPDGTKIAFLYVEGATRSAGALAAMKPPAGVMARMASRCSAWLLRMQPPASRRRRSWERRRTCTRSSSTGRRIPNPSLTLPPSRRGKTTGGRQSSTRRRLKAKRRSFLLRRKSPDLCMACRLRFRAGRRMGSRLPSSAA